ncbi:protein tyrosine kinase [Pycnococcus provasolii]
MSDFVVEGEIAKGSFGVVMRCIRLSDNRQFAIKQVEMKGMNKAEREECIDEARVMSTLDSPYVVRYFDCFIDGTKLCMVMNYAPGGTLHASIRKHPGGLPEEQCWKNVIHVALALRHLHGKNVLHRDIKSLNVFLDEFGDIQVGDLGIARQMSNSTLFAKTVVGTPYYLSPELCEDKPYNTKSDLWALGVLAYEMAAGRHPFDAQNEGALIRKIVKGVYAPLPTARFSKAYCDLVYGLLAKEPLKRPSAAALLGSPAVKAVAERLRQPLDGSPPPARAAAIAAARRAGGC